MENYKMEIYCVETTDGIQWNVEFPEIPGCGGAGDTVEEAIQDAQVNLSVHLDYLREKEIPIPAPGLSLPAAEYSGKLSLRIPRSLHKQIADCAQKEDVSINCYINNALAEYVGQAKAFELIKKELVESLQQYAFGALAAQFLTCIAESGWSSDSSKMKILI